MHIAAAYKRPVISLWGNTVPSFGMYPYYGENYLSSQQKQPYDIFQVSKLTCRPCSKIGYNKCPKGHFKCMENIEVSEVMKAVHARL
jgi:ADP-heptose:LPS heptosyltransferase